MLESLWLTNYKPNRQAKIKLFCFPHAGAAASTFEKWPEQLSTEIELWAVEYPGRGSRRTEKPFVGIQSLVTALLPRISSEFTKPFAVFGLCFGAFVAFELVRRLQLRGGPRPIGLIAAGSRGPSLPLRKPPIHALPKEELIAELRSLNGTPSSILEDPLFIRVFLPALCADLKAAETYSYFHGPRLTCNISAYAGLADPELTPQEIEAWREETTEQFSIQMFPGDHFFLQTAESLVLQRLASDLLTFYAKCAKRDLVAS